MVKVSVIVPIYNVEQYLEKCLDSLVGQTLEGIEIILVNDASPDHSDVIMERYKEKYDNIQTIYLEKNRCLGGARNAGIEIAQGKYIMFVDSDDWLDLDYIEKMYEACEQSGSDIAYSAYKSMSEDGRELNETLFYPIEFSGELTIPKKRGIINGTIMAWGRLYSLALWKEIDLAFPEHLKYEDIATVPIYMLHANKCCCVLNTYYRYLIRQNSILHTRNVGHDDVQKTTLLLVERLKKYGFYEQYLPEIEYFVVNRYYCRFLWRCLQFYDEIPYEKMQEARETVRRMFPQFEKNPYYYLFVPRDRMRMCMNEISPYTCAVWEQEFKDAMAKDENLYPSMQYPFYESKKEQIDNIMQGRKRVGLYGEEWKRKAVRWFFNKHYNMEIVDIENATLEAMDLEELDIIIGVNPSACYDLYGRMADADYYEKVVNFEDTLAGYFVEE